MEARAVTSAQRKGRGLSPCRGRAASALAALPRQGDSPRPFLWALVTALASIHHAWLQPGVDLYLAGCPEGAAVLQAKGDLPNHAVAVWGLPVACSFTDLG